MSAVLSAAAGLTMRLDSIVLPSIYVASMALPPLAALWRWRSISFPLKLLAVYSTVALVESLIARHLALSGYRTLWMMHAFEPIEAALLLWMFSRWQVREVTRLTVLLVIPAYLIAWGALQLTVESFQRFPLYIATVQSLLLIAVAAHTLVTRSRTLMLPMVRFPWFWVSTGALLYFSYVTLLTPISRLLLPHSRNLVLIAYQINAVLGIVASLFFVRAMFCGMNGTVHVPGPASGQLRA